MPLTLFSVQQNDLEGSLPRYLEVKCCKYSDDCFQYDIVLDDGCSHIQAMNAIELLLNHLTVAHLWRRYY